MKGFEGNLDTINPSNLQVTFSVQVAALHTINNNSWCWEFSRYPRMSLLGQTGHFSRESLLSFAPFSVPGRLTPLLCFSAAEWSIVKNLRSQRPVWTEALRRSARSASSYCACWAKVATARSGTLHSTKSLTPSVLPCFALISPSPSPQSPFCQR